MIPREKILWAKPDEPLLALLERLLTADVNQMPVVSATESDGNVIMVGEIRDKETAEIAMRAAQTGHLVLSTCTRMTALRQ